MFVKKIAFRAVAVVALIASALVSTSTSSVAAPVITNLSTPEFISVGEGSNFTLAAIELTTSAKFATVTLQLSYSNSGHFSQVATVDSGTAPIINNRYGTYSVTGSIADVNALLSGVLFTASAEMYASFTIETFITLNTGATFTGVKPVYVDSGHSPLITNIDSEEFYQVGVKHRMKPIVLNGELTWPASVQLSLSDPILGSFSASYTSLGAALSPIGAGQWIVFGTVEQVNRTLKDLYFFPEASGGGSLSIDVSLSGQGWSGSRTLNESVVSQCVAGTYSVTGDDSVSPCLETPAGFFTSEEGATLPVACPAGTFSTPPNPTGCTQVPMGTYSGEASGSYHQCIAGPVTRGIGSTSEFDCVSTSSINASIIPWKTGGTYLPDSNFGVVIPVQSQANSLQMTLMKVSGSSIGATRTIVFRNSGAPGIVTNSRHYYLNVLGDGLGNGYVISPNFWYLIQQVNDSGTMWQSGGSSLDREGRYFVTVSYVNPDGQTVSSDGIYIYLGAAGACGYGQYVVQDLVSERWGAYQFQRGVNCVNATKGYIANNGTRTACATGTYSADERATECTLASAGNFVPSEASSYQIACVAGTYQTLTGQSSCDAVPTGTFANGPGQSSVTECLAGTYQSIEGFRGSSCTPASPGYFVSGPRASSQEPCATGTYQTLSGQSTCSSVPRGTFATGSGQSSVTECSAGTYQSVEGFSGTQCTPADPGHYVAGPRAGSQESCVVGTFQSLSGQSSCTIASSGFYVDSVGATSQTACPVNFTSTLGATSRAACKAMGCIIAKSKSATAACLLTPMNVTPAKTSTVSFQVTSSGSAKCALVKGVVVPKQAGTCSVKVTVKPKVGPKIDYVATIYAT